MSLTIEEQTAEFQSASIGRMPAEIAEVFAREQEKWRQTGPLPGHVGVGDSLTSVTLLDAHENPVELGTLWAGGPLVVVFYRGGWCPYCNIALRAYQTGLVGQLSAFGAQLVAISPQRPDQSLSTQEKDELTFTVLSDPGSRFARAVGIAFEPSDEVRATQRKLGLDLAEVNAAGATELPMPTVLVVDREGVVRFVDVHADYTSRTEVSTILDALRAL